MTRLAPVLRLLLALLALCAPASARAEETPSEPPAPPLPTLPPVQAPAEPSAPPPAQEEKPAEPFAFGDFTWLNGTNRQHKAILDTPYFTPEFLLDVNYTVSTNRPIDNTVVGSTTLSRNNEFTLEYLGFGGDFHYEAARDGV
jgi:hypothetical protein